MQFSDNDIHESMVIALTALIDIIKESNDLTTKGNAAINLANILFEIWDRSHQEFIAEDDIIDGGAEEENEW